MQDFASHSGLARRTQSYAWHEVGSEVLFNPVNLGGMVYSFIVSVSTRVMKGPTAMQLHPLTRLASYSTLSQIFQEW